MVARMLGIAAVLAGLALVGCTGGGSMSDLPNSVGISKDIDATFSTGTDTLNPLRPGSFRD